jgi:hypothetical protein
MMDANKSSNDTNSRRENAIKRFSELEQPKEHCLASYIWLDSSCLTLRYKTRTFDFDPVNPSDIPWLVLTLIFHFLNYSFIILICSFR